MKVALCIPLSWDYVPTLFFESFYRLDLEGLETELFRGRNVLIDRCRNDAAQEALNWGADYLMFFDADGTYPPETVKRLLSHNKDAVSGLTHQKAFPHLPVLWKCRGARKAVVPLDYQGLVKVDLVGLAGVLIKREVLETIPKPWFELTPEYGEDTLFWMKCHNFGIDLWCDTDLIFGHIHTVVVDDKWQEVPKLGEIPTGLKWKKMDNRGQNAV